MKLIIDFYKSLDTLNLIIFWGIIIVIILLLIFSTVLLNKNKKLKKIVEKVNKPEEEIPIKKIEIEKSLEEEKKDINILPAIEITENKEQNNTKTIKTEKSFIAEEHVIGYNNNLLKKDDNRQIKEQDEYKKTQKKEFEIPSKPYQRNVLREMSLSQTSPIGITRPKEKEDRKVEMAKELQESLNASPNDVQVVRENHKEENEQIKKELTNIKNLSPRKTEIRNEERYIQSKTNKIQQEENNTNLIKKYSFNNEEKKYEKVTKKYPEINKTENLKIDKNKEEKIKNSINVYINDSKDKINEELIASPVKELLNSITEVPRNNVVKSSSEKYLEEVSKKLSEAEIQDEIERTDYELEQEENAIISYKELMEKKDSIQTIDEEDAIISIEELMNRNNNQDKIEEDIKLYNITEEEANDEFLNQLKQFRNDL